MKPAATHALRHSDGKPLCDSREKLPITTDVRSWVTCRRCQQALEAGEGAR